MWNAQFWKWWATLKECPRDLLLFFTKTLQWHILVLGCNMKKVKIWDRLGTIGGGVSVDNCRELFWHFWGTLGTLWGHSWATLGVLMGLQTWIMFETVGPQSQAVNLSGGTFYGWKGQNVQSSSKNVKIKANTSKLCILFKLSGVHYKNKPACISYFKKDLPVLFVRCQESGCRQ